MVTGKRVSGTYQAGAVTVTKALGSCEDTKGMLSATIRVGQSNVDFPHRRRP